MLTYNHWIMKTTFKIYLTLAVIAFLTASCSRKYLDVIPKDQLTDAVFWKSEKDADLALIGIYRGWEDYRQVGWLDMMSDIAYSKFPTPLQVMGNGQLSALNPGLTFFNYAQIRKYNNFLEKVDQIEMDAAKKTLYKAEARFLRAYNYWRKIQSYGDMPLVTTLIDDAEEAKLPRNPKSEVVTFILNELQEIIPLLPVQTMRQSGGRVTRGAALALKARMELYEGMYPQAMASAKAVMDMGIYELFPNYNELFDDDNESLNNESIMEVFYVMNDFSNLLWIDVTAGSLGNGYAVICPTAKLTELYEMANGKPIDDPTSGYDPDQPYLNRDPRLDMTVLRPGLFWYNGKYWDPYSPGIDNWQGSNNFRSGYGFTKFAKFTPQVDNCGQNIMIFRLAEMLLTYAEAAIEANQLTDEMYDAIDAVRLRAGMPAVDKVAYNTQEKLRALVRRERAVELAFEGLRYYDIKRWNIGAERLDGPLYGTRLGSVNQSTGAVTFLDESIKLEDRVFHANRQYLLPIPQTELDANPNISQNPGY